MKIIGIMLISLTLTGCGLTGLTKPDKRETSPCACLELKNHARV